MASPGGYQVTPGLYRVPDLLTEEQFVEYMWSTYRRKVEFTDVENQVNTDRVLGKTASMGVIDEEANPHSFRDPVLRRINEMNFSDAPQETKPKPVEKKTTVTKPTGK